MPKPNNGSPVFSLAASLGAVILRLWLTLLLVCAGALAPSAHARGAETRVGDFFLQLQDARPDSEPQVADPHLGILGYGYELMPGNCLAAENVGANGAMNAARLRTQLAAEEIAGGHAYGKHVGEFPGITSPKQFAGEVERVMTNASDVRNLSGGRTAFWDSSTGTVVIRNPAAVDGGMALKPTAGKAYFDNLK